MSFALVVIGLIVASVGVQIVLSKRRAKDFAPADDAIAERWAVPFEPFELAIPASGPIDLVLTMHADGTSSREHLHWGIAVELRAERPPAGQDYRGGAGHAFVLATQAFAGSRTPRNDTGLARTPATVLDASNTATQADVKLLLARIPAGEAFVLRGKVETSAQTSTSSVWIAAHAARGG